MKTPIKHYTVHVQFKTIGFEVSAKSAVEARRKVCQKVSRRNAARLIDPINTFVDRISL